MLAEGGVGCCMLAGGRAYDCAMVPKGGRADRQGAGCAARRREGEGEGEACSEAGAEAGGERGERQGGC
jgi:hypothetical protein